MDESLERIIRRTLEEARSKGWDCIMQTQLAVTAARKSKPEMTASEALAAVCRVQRE